MRFSQILSGSLDENDEARAKRHRRIIKMFNKRVRDRKTQRLTMGLENFQKNSEKELK